MSKQICHICGELYSPYNSPNYAAPIEDTVAVRIYNKKTEYLETKQWWTCRHCATTVRAYIDKLSRESKGEFE